VKIPAPRREICCPLEGPLALSHLFGVRQVRIGLR